MEILLHVSPNLLTTLRELTRLTQAGMHREVEEKEDEEDVKAEEGVKLPAGRRIRHFEKSLL